MKRGHVIAPNSNGHIALVLNMAKRAGLPWDVILGGETARAYKPMPECYMRNATLLNLDPSEVMLVAAHNNDLAAAARTGYRTAFVIRRSEHGPGQDKDLEAERAWDVVTDSFIGLADAMGCPRR